MSSPTATSPIPYDIKGLFAPEVVADPFPVYDELRARTPAPTTDGVWVVMRYADAIAAATNHRTFSSNMQHIDNEVLRRTPIIFEDPPGHTRHRKLVQPAFTAKRMTELAPWVDGVVDELVSAIPAGVELDAVSAFCDPLPVERSRGSWASRRSGTSTSRRGPTSGRISWPGEESRTRPRRRPASRPRRRRTAACSSTSSPRRAPGGRSRSTT